jgi:hypothetical protein
MTIGDWDRHNDQWRWARMKSDEQDCYLYRPIPRDRDQPFSKFDGLALNIINRTHPLARQLQSFGPDIERMKWYNNYARYFDSRFLNELDWNQWEKEIKYIQEHLTDEIIEEALHFFPELIFEEDGLEIIHNIKTRRANLLEIGREYFELLTKEVEVVCTKSSEFIEIDHSEHNTIVTISDNQNKRKGKILYKRKFKFPQTKEIRIYGLAGDDIFQVHGKAKKVPRIRIIGGKGDDEVYDNSEVSSIGKNNIVYDHPKGIVVEGGLETSIRTTTISINNEYNDRDLQRNYSLFLPIIAYNNDDGLSFGLGWHYTHYGFKKYPYEGKHKLSLRYAIQTNASKIEYSGKLVSVIPKWDLQLNGLYQEPRYTLNFFGMGNATTDERNENAFNQVRQSKLHLNPGMSRRLYNNLILTLGVIYEGSKIDSTANRYISSPDIVEEIGKEIFSYRTVLGPQVSIKYDTRNNHSFPTRGLTFSAKSKYERRVIDHQDIITSDLTLSIYRGIALSQDYVWASQIGFTYIAGDFDFYQSATLGQNKGLRGVRHDRFRGRSSLWLQNDFRAKISSIKNRIVPIDIGMTLSYDLGKVFLNTTESNITHHDHDWHSSIGGSVWFRVMGGFVLNAGVHRTRDDHSVLAGIGFEF